MSKIAIIVGSTRQGRATPAIAESVAKVASEEGVSAEVVDLQEYELPFFDESISPQYNPDRTPSPAVSKWLEKMAAFDGYVIVTPEYNRSYPAVLKNALDYIDYQMKQKPVALVAHGSSGGAQSVSHLRGALAGLLAVTVPEATFILDPSDEDRVKSMLEATIGSLRWYTEALVTARGAAVTRAS